jgi:saccharopine dehydrogenase-like NADP-dependent oxidoreductase
LQHVFEAVSQPFSVLEHSRARTARPFSEGKRVEFPEPLGARKAYLFPWSDVVFYPKTLGVHTAVGRFALDPPWVARLASLIARASGGGGPQRRGLLRGNRRAIERLKHLYAGHDRFALVVTAHSRERAMQMSLAGRHQADATAAGAAELARVLAANEVEQPGVWLPEQVVSHDKFFAALAQLGWKPTMEQIRHDAQQGNPHPDDRERHAPLRHRTADHELQRPADRGPRL